MRARPTARALVTAPGGSVLLLRVHDDVPLDASDPVLDYWITVGGGVEPGETFEQAVVREVFEETGHRVDDPGPCVWRRRHRLTDAAGVVRESDERYFWCPVASTALDTSHQTAAESAVIRDMRWWGLDDPGLRAARIFPNGFVDAAAEVLANGRPPQPVWLR